MTADGDGGQVQIKGAVLIPADPEQPSVPGVRLTLDRRGVVVEWGSTEPRVVHWEAVAGWRVDPDEREGASGALVTVTTSRATFRFAARDADPVSLGYAVDALCAHFTERQAASVADPAPPNASGSVAQEAADAPQDPSPEARTGRDRWKPVVVVALVLVLATAVSLLLAESAGAIHWPILGGGSAGTPGTMLR